MADIDARPEPARSPRPRTAAFTDAQIEAGFWLLAARAAALETDGAPAEGAEDLLGTLEPLIDAHGPSRAAVTAAIGPILVAKAAAAAGGLPSPSAARTDELRSLILKEWGVESGKGVLLWPTGARTIAVRLGDGNWNRAMTRLGLKASGRGRAPGSGRFDEAAVRTILREYMESAEDEGAAATLGGYASWSKAQRAAGRTDVPSAASVRQRFGTWGRAIASVLRI